jgi:hypothetical protein
MLNTRDISDSTKIKYDNSEIDKLDISNIKLGKYSYTLKFTLH